MLSISEIWEKYKKLMYNISKASFISLFILLIIFYLSTLPTFKSSINKAFSPLSLSILIFYSFLITLGLLYKIGRDTLTNKLTNTLPKLEKLYPEVPSIIMGIGFSLLLIAFLVIINIPPIAPIPSTVYGLILTALTGFGFFFILIGFLLLILSLSARKYLEGRVIFTLKKANEILDKVEDKNQIDTKNLKRYIYLTYKNIKKKVGEELKLEPTSKSDGISTLDLEYTFFKLFTILYRIC